MHRLWSLVMHFAQPHHEFDLCAHLLRIAAHAFIDKVSAFHDHSAFPELTARPATANAVTNTQLRLHGEFFCAPAIAPTNAILREAFAVLKLGDHATSLANFRPK